MIGKLGTQSVKFKIKAFSLKFLVLSFSFAFFAFSFEFSGLVRYAYALDLDKVKINLLSSNYAGAIKEGERVLAASSASSENLDELYYFLGLSYLKSGNYLRASDIFEIILKEFKNSRFENEALLGLGDALFLKGDYAGAEGKYRELLNAKDNKDLQSVLYYRLSQAGFKQGKTEQAAEYLNKLKNDFPQSLEARLNRELFPPPVAPAQPGSVFYYTVQVGSFSNKANAGNLVKKLQGYGYPAFVEEVVSKDKKNYRVRIGKFRTRAEAQDMEKKLSKQGYPTKIFP
ncbi:MAG: SPOR domain-containing protein [Candidatus Omnitrophota bacterium]